MAFFLVIILSLLAPGCVAQNAADIRAKKFAQRSATPTPIAINTPTCASDSLELARMGKFLYQGKAVCSGCHGREGKGDGDPASLQLMNPKPTDLSNDAMLKHRTDEARYSAIRHGIPGTAMPPFRGHLTDQEIRLIIEYLEVLRTGQC